MLYRKDTWNQKKNIALRLTVAALAVWAAGTAAAAEGSFDYRVLATSKTSTMEKELNEAAAAGFRFSKAVGGKSAEGGSELVVAMVKDDAEPGRANREYRLLATNKTSTMQKELQEAGDAGFVYKDQTVYETAFSGREVVIILERDPSSKKSRASYKLLATSRTSTLQKELQDAGAQGYELLGLTVGKTEFGGEEVLAVVVRR